jgi:hypothetical protein
MLAKEVPGGQVLEMGIKAVQKGLDLISGEVSQLQDE